MSPPVAHAAISDVPDSAPAMTNGQVNAIARSADRIFLGGSFTRVGTGTPRGVALSTVTSLANPAFAHPNGTVRAAVPDGSGGYYIGGEFTQVGTVPRNRIAHIAADGTVNPSFDPNVNGSVLALALSGSTLYAGGSFNGANSVNGTTTRNRLAAFDIATGTDTSFNPNVNGSVLALAVSGTTLYAGGLFSSVNTTTTRNRLAAFDT
ncbi:delta-60 repeat domain-containing protein, partial [Paraconexibacter sp.]|uniref:delta-60 repeat domain-containing protein n=1 Tax=Paraconexibacter sp. TaxID=2949640 RepID=UPI0035682049